MKGPWEKRLILVLRATAVLTMTAVAAVVMPLAWMSAIHEALGMGPLPEGPIVSYLARSTSAFYAIHGVLLWLVSTDLKRFDPVLSVMIWTGLPFALFLFALDHQIGMPANWKWGEGPCVTALLAAILVLRRRARKEWA